MGRGFLDRDRVAAVKRVVVVGAGPAGATAAMALASEPRVECVMLERWPLPRTKPCGSGLSPWTLSFLDRLGVGDMVRARAFRIDGAVIGGRRGTAPVELRGDHETAVLLRSEFDWLLAREAVRRGAELRDGVRVQRLLCHPRGQVSAVETRTGIIECDAVIDASGARGRVTNSRFEGAVLHTFMGWYQGVAETSDVVELYFDDAVAPHYGWIFPESRERVNIGICFLPERARGNARERFESFVDARLGARLAGAERVGSFVGHPVRVTARARAQTLVPAPGVLVAGEAAGLADYATAEGIYHALVSGHLAGRSLADILANGDVPTRTALAPYARAVHRQLGLRLFGGFALLRALRTPALQLALAFGGSRVVKRVLARAFAGLYHG